MVDSPVEFVANCKSKREKTKKEPGILLDLEKGMKEHDGDGRRAELRYGQIEKENVV